MEKILFLCGFLILGPLASAMEITVGATRLTIPTPASFVPVTDAMQPYAKFAERFVPSSNVQYASFLPAADAASAARGGLPQSGRKFYVQTAKAIVDPFVSTADFNDLKQTIKAQNAGIMKQVETQMPGFFKKLNQGIVEDYKLDPKLAITQMVPLPAHDETERSLAYSMILKYNVADEKGNPTVFEGVVTATFVHLQGKILFLYVNAEKSGLEWTRTESRKWAAEVVAANPSVGDVAVRETSQRRSGLDWGEVGKMAVVGAVIGGIFGLIRMIFKKRAA